MKFKIDENLPLEVAGLLRDSGYDSATVFEQNLTGTSDTGLAAICQEEKRILVTLDNDFADIRAYPPDKFPGIMVIRLNRQDKDHVLDVFGHAMRLFPKEPIEQRLWIVEEDRIRVRS
jgi:predicted nuclease of predicted toxin-antitoxin system